MISPAPPTTLQHRERSVPAKRNTTSPTPEAQLEAFLDRLEPAQQKLMRSLRTAMRKRFPTANELAYDYGHSVLISYSPTERGMEGVVSIATRDDGVRLYFNQGPKLPDPKRLLKGTGKQARYIEIASVGQLKEPDVEALLAAAVRLSPTPFPAKGKGILAIRGAAAKG